MVSVGEVASKVQAVNVGGLKKNLPICPVEPGSPWSPRVSRLAELFQSSNIQFCKKNLFI